MILRENYIFTTRQQGQQLSPWEIPVLWVLATLPLSQLPCSRWEALLLFPIFLRVIPSKLPEIQVLHIRDLVQPPLLMRVPSILPMTFSLGEDLKSTGLQHLMDLQRLPPARRYQRV